MKEKIRNCTGKLKIWGCDCFFAFSDGYLLKVTPEKEYRAQFDKKCKELHGIFDSLGWVHGIDDWQYDIAFLLTKNQGPFCFYKGTVTLFVDVIVRTDNTKDIISGKYLYGYKDLTGFSSIDFYGEPIAAVFSPKRIFETEEKPSKNEIKWLEESKYAQEYETIIEGQKCHLIFSVAVDRCDLSPCDLSIGSLKPFIRLEFEERQNMAFVVSCWESVCTFLSFCVGSFNVTDLEIGLWDEKHRIGINGFISTFFCQINHEETESIHFEYPPYYRFQANSLGIKLGNLFALLNRKETKPVMKYLPKDKTDYTVDRNKIRELCTALEVEFEYRKGDFPYDKLSDLICNLKKTVKEYKTDHPGEIEDNEYDYVFGSLANIDLSARRKITMLYNRYAAIIKKTIEENYMLKSERVDFSDSQSEKDIGWMVKTRNSITHSTGIDEQLIPNAIFFRLKLVVFCSVLERSGYSFDEIERIMHRYANGNFEH